jgi:hypothetical protein
MVVLGTTIHEFARTARSHPSELVDGRTKSDHDEMVVDQTGCVFA